MSATPHTEERLSFRLEADKKRVIERAAAVRSQTLTEFAISILYREAQEVLKEEHVLILSDEERDAFLAALDNPPAPNDKLKLAAQRYTEAKGSGDLR